jgi:hypothetical protein
MPVFSHNLIKTLTRVCGGGGGQNVEFPQVKSGGIQNIPLGFERSNPAQGMSERSASCPNCFGSMCSLYGELGGLILFLNLQIRLNSLPLPEYKPIAYSD